MKNLFLLFALCVGMIAQAQDKIYKHSGEVIEGNVLKVQEFTIVFTYQGENTEYTLSRYAIEKIVHKSGRVEEISNKIDVSGKDGWQNVVILEEKSLVAGLKEQGRIKGKNSSFTYRSAEGADKKAEKKLKMAAAKEGCPFILMTEDKANSNNGGGVAVGGYRRGYSGAVIPSVSGVQVFKKGVAYKY